MQIKSKAQEGHALMTALIFIVIFFIMTAGLLSLVSTEVHMSQRHYESTKAFFLAESGIERAMASLRDAEAIPSHYSLSLTGVLHDSPGLDDVMITVTSVYQGNNLYEVTSSATVRNSTRIVKAELLYNPPSPVFDYAYFINNWGWFYGSGITASGDVRSNGRFDFRYNPRVDGEVYAGQGIGGGEYIKGKAATKEDGEYIYQHPNSPMLDMPNLQSLGYYSQEAIDNHGSIEIAGTKIVDGVYGDDAGESGNIVLVGTPSKPIEVNGPVVITGDVIIKGTVKGQGTIYAGRNIYVADNITYKNAPNSPRPANDKPETVDEWVEANRDKDLVGFTARENIVLGDYTKSTQYGYYGRDRWYSNYWLFDMGGEDVGKDGIPGTGDALEGDGKFQKDYEDTDGDGAFDDNYNWPDIEPQTNIKNFANLPKGVKKFSDLARNSVSKVEGIYYTNHAFAGRVGYGTKINGAIISKDEAIIYRNTITMNYDERAHSRYREDPNWLIDLNLPSSERVGVVGWWEEAPK